MHSRELAVQIKVETQLERFKCLKSQEEQNRLSCLALNDAPGGAAAGGHPKQRNKAGRSKSFKDTTGQKKASGGHQRSMSRYRYKMTILVVKEKRVAMTPPLRPDLSVCTGSHAKEMSPV